MNALVTMLDGTQYIIEDFERLSDALREADKNGCQHLFGNEEILTVRQIGHIKAIEKAEENISKYWERCEKNHRKLCIDKEGNYCPYFETKVEGDSQYWWCNKHNDDHVS